jgi:hypothetical protein
MAGSLLSFVTQIAFPIAASIAILSYLSRARSTEELCYTLVGILAVKGLIEVEDLIKLGMFEPRDDMLDLLTGLLESAR